MDIGAYLEMSVEQLLLGLVLQVTTGGMDYEEAVTKKEKGLSVGWMYVELGCCLLGGL